MPLKRREFIRNGLSFVALGAAMPTVLMQAARAAENPAPGAVADNSAIPDGKILVVIEMSGGNDGLNTVVPYKDASYKTLRPGIGVSSRDVKAISANLGVHPKMEALSKMFEQGRVAVINGVGYPSPNRSHFDSMDIWQTGNPTRDISHRSGWLARYFDADGHLKGKPMAGVVVGGAMPLAFTGDVAAASVFTDQNNYFGVGGGSDRDLQNQMLQELYAQGTVAGSNADFSQKIGNDAYANSQEFKRALNAYDTRAGKQAEYPRYNGFANGLQTIAKLVTGGVKTRVYYLSLGGFDTHANQPYNHGQLLRLLADSVSAFYEDLKMQGRDKDVCVMTFSEFGRRAKENASSGTDHGAASVMFVVGGGVKGGIYGDYPSLTDLDDGDLKFHTDFRQVYATLLDKWLASPSQTVLNSQFSHLDFL